MLELGKGSTRQQRRKLNIRTIKLKWKKSKYKISRTINQILQLKILFCFFVSKKKKKERLRRSYLYSLEKLPLAHEARHIFILYLKTSFIVFSNFQKWISVTCFIMWTGFFGVCLCTLAA